MGTVNLYEIKRVIIIILILYLVAITNGCVKSSNTPSLNFKYFISGVQKEKPGFKNWVELKWKEFWIDISLIRALKDISFMFIGLYLALLLNNWNLKQKDKKDAMIYLKEILKQIKDDIDDIKSNIGGHEKGIRACTVFENYYLGNEVCHEALTYYYHYLTRDFICVSNSSAYETLQSRGLNIITNNSLRFLISKVYSFRYDNIKKLEEEYEEGQFFKNYEREINDIFGKQMNYKKYPNNETKNKPGSIEYCKGVGSMGDAAWCEAMSSTYEEFKKGFWMQSDLEWLPINKTEKIDFRILWLLRRIKYNRMFTVKRYKYTLEDLSELKTLIEKELKLEKKDKDQF